jgi:hypothetical protein
VGLDSLKSLNLTNVYPNKNNNINNNNNNKVKSKPIVVIIRTLKISLNDFLMQFLRPLYSRNGSKNLLIFGIFGN